MGITPDHFPTEVEGLPEAHAPERVELSDGDEFNLRIGPVAKRIGDYTVRMLAYNDSIPGPVLEVQEGSEIVVNVENQGDMEATVHWHGLRLENRYDGTHETQAPIQVGGRFSARLAFPDPGAYWYHPHIREDYGQELGLYGNVLVEPADRDYWAPANRDIPLTLDDILLEDGRSRRSAGQRRLMWQWAASARCCWSTARRTSHWTRSSARSSASTSRTPRTPVRSRSRFRAHA